MIMPFTNVVLEQPEADAMIESFVRNGDCKDAQQQHVDHHLLKGSVSTIWDYIALLIFYAIHRSTSSTTPLGILAVSCLPHTACYILCPIHTHLKPTLETTLKHQSRRALQRCITQTASPFVTATRPKHRLESSRHIIKPVQWHKSYKQSARNINLCAYLRQTTSFVCAFVGAPGYEFASKLSCHNLVPMLRYSLLLNLRVDRHTPSLSQSHVAA